MYASVYVQLCVIMCVRDIVSGLSRARESVFVIVSVCVVWKRVCVCMRVCMCACMRVYMQATVCGIRTCVHVRVLVCA